MKSRANEIGQVSFPASDCQEIRIMRRGNQWCIHVLAAPSKIAPTPVTQDLRGMVGGFVAEMCERDVTEPIGLVRPFECVLNELKSAFASWLEERNIRERLSGCGFTIELKKMGLKTRQSNGKTICIGARLKTPGENLRG